MDDAAGEMAALRTQISRLKHGPGGTGRSGPCDPVCVKCELERQVRALRAPVVNHDPGDEDGKR